MEFRSIENRPGRSHQADPHRGLHLHPLSQGQLRQLPAHGDASGVTAGCNVDLAFDLLGGAIITWDIAANFRIIEELRAWWLSRLPLNADILTEDGIPLETILRDHRGIVIDIRVKLTAGGHPVRHTAIRARKDGTAKRRPDHRARAAGSGRTRPARSLVRDSWHLMVTNIPRSLQSTEELADLYSQRWQIEIIFRAWKHACNLGKALNHTSNAQHHKALVLAGM